MSGTNPVFATLPLQNRFQALLDEIIQQEEREMEQVKTLLPKRGNEWKMPRCEIFSCFPYLDVILHVHWTVIYKPWQQI